jgi:hypothetical protein
MATEGASNPKKSTDNVMCVDGKNKSLYCYVSHIGFGRVFLNHYRLLEQETGLPLMFRIAQTIVHISSLSPQVLPWEKK